MTDSSAVPLSLRSKYEGTSGELFMTGVQALARVPLDQMRLDRLGGRSTATFVSGYPGSPLAGLDQEFAKMADLLRSLDIVHQPGLNEELAATAVLGSQMAAGRFALRYDGVLGIWYGKSPGLDRASDALRHAGIFGVPRTGGALAFVGDDPSAKSSTIPSGSEQLLASLNMVVLCPGSVQEVLDLGLHGVAISRASGLWTALKIVTAVADGAGSVDVDLGRASAMIDTIDVGQRGLDRTLDLSLARVLAAEESAFTERLDVARSYAAAAGLNRISGAGDGAWLGIVAPSHVHHTALQALERLGIDATELSRRGVRMLSLGMLHPFDTETVDRFSEGLERILVIEEKRPFFETLLKEHLYDRADRPLVLGKADGDGTPLIPVRGGLGPDNILEPVRRILRTRIADNELAAVSGLSAVAGSPRVKIPVRTPYFCSGCPHNTSLEVPEGTLVGAGIGCHGMVGLMQTERVGTITGVTQMGGEGAQWIGIAPFVDDTHFTQNVGDGTYFHSAQLSIRAAVAAHANMTFKLLFNEAVGMTGGQASVGSGTALETAEVLVRQGVAAVVITTEDPGKYRRRRHSSKVSVMDRTHLVKAQERLREIEGVTVLIHDQRCAAEARRLRKRGEIDDPPVRVVVAERVCEGCGDCAVKSNCLSVLPVETEFGQKRTIDQSSCNKDYTCIQGDCPSFVTVTPKTSWRARATPKRTVELPPMPLPEPEMTVRTDDMTIRMPGVGGTGVVTVSQVLGTAATLSGLHVTSLDQTGLSQKAGPVVSDLRITAEPTEKGGTVENGGVDLYLVFDLGVGVGRANLAGASADRTIAVVSTDMTPPGTLITQRYVAPFDPTDMLALLDSATRADLNVRLNPREIARSLFGDTLGANFVQLGVAYQCGALPMPAGAIEQAIELNGVAVEMNVAAFRWGRAWMVDPGAVNQRMVIGGQVPRHLERVDALVGNRTWPSEVDEEIRLRATDLVDYQGEGIARKYLDFVERVATAESERCTSGAELTKAVGRYLYKLMAYKDEYEVARLLLGPQVRQAAGAAIKDGGDFRVSYNLHPPILRSLGLRRKLRFGPWFKPVLLVLRSMRRLRGTPFDPMGMARVRRLERRLVEEYMAVIDQALMALDDGTVATAVELASLPERIRGYEDIKVAAVESYCEAQRSLCADLGIDVRGEVKIRSSAPGPQCE